MPPTLRELLSDPVFRTYYLKVPRLPHPISQGQPWQVWAVTHDGRWGSRLFETYKEAWDKAIVFYKESDKFRDVCIVSRRMMFPPPRYASWRFGLSWCSRCRRPSEFRERSPQHHALRKQLVLTDDEPRRCYYCGIRKAAMPHYNSARWS